MMIKVGRPEEGIEPTPPVGVAPIPPISMDTPGTSCSGSSVYIAPDNLDAAGPQLSSANAHKSGTLFHVGAVGVAHSMMQTA